MWLSAQIQPESFEKQAISAAQQIPAYRLDAKLPNISFVAWLNGLVGQEAGVVWQLGECGVSARDRTWQDMQACAEATALLPNGNKVVVGILVGTFKKGLIGEPTFLGAVIDSAERLYQVRRLSELPELLRPPSGLPRILNPQADLLQVVMRSSTAYPAPAPEFPALDEDGAPPPPPSRQNSAVLAPANVITRVRPVYPIPARMMGVSGKVNVRIVISETGRVIETKALSGPMALRDAAMAAARQWVYKPATRNGVPVKSESVVVFTFNPGDQ
jgi:protein TonB